jgi:hypothetical protein
MVSLYACGIFVMSFAIKSIVDGYVSLKDRNSLEDLRQHRQLLRRRVNGQATEFFDVSRTIQILDEDIQMIEAGISQL